MILTNKLGLPSSIVKAVARDPYTRGDAHISVTGLIGPARKRMLEHIHKDELTEDVADRIWALMGQIAHGILERADDEAWCEERLYITRHGWKISGQFDRVLLEENGLLQDYKLTSTYSVKNDTKKEWIAQANLYRLMLREHGYKVDRLQIVAILRDWQKSKAKHDLNYPQAPCAVIDLPIWEAQETEAFITERLMAHGMAQTELPQCSDDERWMRGEKWALMKIGNKKATSLHDTEEAALEALKEAGDKFKIEHRKGENIRCQDYCSAAPFCNQWKELNRVTRIDFST